MFDNLEFLAECHRAKKIAEVMDVASRPLLKIAAAAAIIIIAWGVKEKESRR